MSDSSPTAPFAERFSDGFQSILQKLLGTQNQSSPRYLKSFLNGTWLGHPLHPVITDIPVTAWLLTLIFDIAWLISHSTWAAIGAFVTVIVGLIAALGAVATGLTDWSDTYGAERSVGLNHAIFNGLAFLLYLVSFILRLVAGPGDTVLAFILGLLGLISMVYAANLGGDMVYVKGTSVNHTAWEAGSEDYEAVMAVDAVQENTLHRVLVAGVPVVLLRQGESFYAIAATCPHAGGPLDEGPLTGDVVTCPWHGSRFCMRDGKRITGPTTVDAPRYDVKLDQGQVMLKRVGGH